MKRSDTLMLASGSITYITFGYFINSRINEIKNGSECGQTFYSYIYAFCFGSFLYNLFALVLVSKIIRDYRINRDYYYSIDS